MREGIRKLLNFLGYNIHKASSPPYGVNAIADLQRFSPRPIKTLFDVGANGGQTVFEFKKHCPNLKIWAFEPIAKTYQQLLKNTSHISDLRCFQIALGNSTSSLEVYTKTDSQQNSLNSQLNTPTPDRETVQIVRLDDFLLQHQIDYIDVLKSDTENFDLQVMQGGEGALRSGKVGFVLSEVGFSPHDQLHTNFHELSSTLSDFGFEFMGVYDRMYHHLHPRLRGWGNALYMHHSLLGDN